jgi:large subunit ribosomal protein L15
MSINNLAKIKSKSSKRVGRGPGSGKGKTGGKGTKGQNVRGKIPLTHSHYEGGQRPLFKRLPYRRGKGNKSLSKKPLVVNLSALNNLPKNSTVDLKLLIEHKIVDANDARVFGVKILGDGNLAIPLVITLPISKNAAKKVEGAKGKITPFQIKKNQQPKVKKSTAQTGKEVGK